MQPHTSATATDSRLSDLGAEFSAAVQQCRLHKAVAVARAAEPSGLCTPKDWELLQGPSFFAAASATKDTSAILSFLHSLPASAPTHFTYQHAISACRSAGDSTAAFSVLSLMLDRGAPLDAFHCSAALASTKQRGDVEVAFQWFARMTASGVTPDGHMLAALAATCSSRIRTLRDLRQRSRGASHVGGIQGARRQQLVLADRAQGLLNLLPQTGTSADTPLWNAVIECVAFSGQLDSAFSLLDDMLSGTCPPDSRTYVALITACNGEGERDRALKAYRMALMHRSGTLRVHTAALGACLLRENCPEAKAQDLAAARDIHQDVLRNRLKQDVPYKNKLILALGCNGALREALDVLAAMPGSRTPPSKATAAASVRACVSCAEPSRAHSIFTSFISKGMVPEVETANALMAAYAAVGNMDSAVDVLEEAVAAGIVPQSGTAAALVSGCQRCGSHDLAFQVAQAAQSRGISIDGPIGFMLLRACHNHLRDLWLHARAHPPPNHHQSRSSDSSRHAASHPSPDLATTSSDPSSTPPPHSPVDSHPAFPPAATQPQWADRMLHAITGLASARAAAPGPDHPRNWRDRAHHVFQELITTGVPITPRILERAITCMMLDVGRGERARTPDTLPPIDPSLTVIARLDNRFDPRAYKYIEDCSADGYLPSLAVGLGARTIDLRSLLPATAEAFVLQLFHTLFRHLRREGAAPSRSTCTIALIVPPFHPGHVNKPAHSQDRAALPLTPSSPPSPPPDHYLSATDDESDESFAATMRRRVRKLERMHSLDLSALRGGPDPDASAPHQVGLAVASALRCLKVHCTMHASYGLLLCDSDDLSSWSHRRHINLLSRLQHRKRKSKRGSTTAQPQAPLSESDSEAGVVSSQVLSSNRTRALLEDVVVGDLTPGLRQHGSSQVAGVPGAGVLAANHGILKTQTSSLRSASMHVPHASPHSSARSSIGEGLDSVEVGSDANE